MKNNHKYSVLSQKISSASYDEVIEKIDKAIFDHRSLLISPIASQTLVKSLTEAGLNLSLQSFNLLCPDSQWIRHSLYFLYGVKMQDRIYGPRLMLKICKEAEKKKYRIFLYGCTKETLSNLKTSLKNSFPKLKILRAEPSVFHVLTEDEIKHVCYEVKKNKTDILFIGIGSPAQERLAVKLKTYMGKACPVILTVGAAFDFISGVKKQAPYWVGDAGFEWLYRLIQEPRRLWKRYLVYGTLFIFLIIKQKIFSKNYREK